MSSLFNVAPINGERQLSWLSSFTNSAEEGCKELSVPGRKTENWKYTNLKKILEGGFYSPQNFTTEAVSPSASDVSTEILDKINKINALKVVLIDGVYSETLSSSQTELPRGITLVQFSKATPSQQALIAANIGSVLAASDSSQHPFAILNGRHFVDGLLLHIEKNTHVDDMIQIVSVVTGGDSSLTVNNRLLVIAENNSLCTVIERFIDMGMQSSLTNWVSEFKLLANSQLHHYRLHEEQETAVAIGGVHVELAADALFNSFNLAYGAKLIREDIVIQHKGKGAHSDLNGVYLPRNSQHVDYHTTIEHAVPLCTSTEIFRGIIGDSARAVFNGRIHIHRDAQKTYAQLSNKNLLTSKKAEIDTKPELEIYADDVQCAHGATVAQLEGESVHYLQTRGISPQEAKVMLSFGFINELINLIKHEEVANYIRPQLADLFAKEPELLEHLG